jgi:hypothetical protein
MSYNSPFSGDVIQPTDVSYRSVTLSANTQLVWPIDGGNNVTARIMNVSATAGSLSLYMPPANQASVGEDVLFVNVGANTFTVKEYANGSTITTLAAGETKYLYITSNADTGGTWGAVAMGTATSATDASALAGAGLLAISNTLNQAHAAESLVTGTTFAESDRASIYIWTGGAGTATLPATGTLNANWFLLLKNNGTGSLTLGTTSSQLLDGSTSKVFAPGESAFVLCVGSEYVTVGYGVSTDFVFTAFTKAVTSGNYTLTANEASNTIQTYTGTLSGNVTITFPPVANLYVISNRCTAGSYTFTITTGVSGGANAVIPSSAQSTLICDGTNFYNANTTQAGATSLSIISGSAGAPSLNFASETNTGIYRPGSNRFGVTVNGALVLDVTTSGITVTGTGTFSGGISGGTF